MASKVRKAGDKLDTLAEKIIEKWDVPSGIVWDLCDLAREYERLRIVEELIGDIR